MFKEYTKFATKVISINTLLFTRLMATCYQRHSHVIFEKSMNNKQRNFLPKKKSFATRKNLCSEEMCQHFKQNLIAVIFEQVAEKDR